MEFFTDFYNFSVPNEQTACRCPEELNALILFAHNAAEDELYTMTSFMSRLRMILCNSECTTKVLDLSYCSLSAEHQRMVESIVLQSPMLEVVDMRNSNIAYCSDALVKSLEEAAQGSRSLQLILLPPRIVENLFKQPNNPRSPGMKLVSAEVREPLVQVRKRFPPVAPPASKILDEAQARMIFAKYGLEVLDCFRDEDRVNGLIRDRNSVEIQTAKAALLRKPPYEARNWAKDILRHHNLEADVVNYAKTEKYIAKLRASDPYAVEIPRLLSALNVLDAYVLDVLSRNDLRKSDLGDPRVLMEKMEACKKGRELDADELGELLEWSQEYSESTGTEKARRREDVPETRTSIVKRRQRY